MCRKKRGSSPLDVNKWEEAIRGYGARSDLMDPCNCPTLLPQRHHFSLPAAVPRRVFLVDWPTTPRLHRSMPLPSLSALGGGSDDTSTPLLDVVVLDGDDEQELYEQPPPGPSLGERHSVDGETISPLTAEQKAEAARCLRGTTMFKFCSDESILSIVEHMRREQFSEGEVGRIFLCGFKLWIKKR